MATDASNSPSSRDVAARAGVSQSTVSRVINGFANVRPGTRARIERAMAELGYVPNAAARSLITRRTGLLGLVVSNITNGFYPEIIDTITATAFGLGYSVIVGSAGEQAASQHAFLRLLAEQRVDGIILTTALLNDAALREALARTSVPIVLANRVLDSVPVDQVALDNVAAGRLATLHLAAHGRTAVAYVGGLVEAPTDAARLAGYRGGLADAGIRTDSWLISHGSFSRASGNEQTRAFLAGGTEAADRRIDAIVAADDTVALGCLDALAEARLRVPDDVSVVGFDDIEAAGLSGVALTTVSTAAHLMGTEAVRLLLARIGGADGPPERVSLAPALVIRRTCGPHEPTPGPDSIDGARGASSDLSTMDSPQHAASPALTRANH